MWKRFLGCVTAAVICLLCVVTPGMRVHAYNTWDLSIPSSAQAIQYGTSGAGRNLTAYRFGTGRNVMVLGFAIHGYEDNWRGDGEALVYTAGQLMQLLHQNSALLQDYGWSIYVLPCMNPDGLTDGWTKDGPGRCTTTYINSAGKLVSGGVDMNRSFPTRWQAYSGSRNFNGSAPLASKESRALAQFVQSVKGSGTNICIDAHGWMSQIITSNGTGSSLYSIFKAAFPGNTWANCNNGRGYFTAYTASLGYASCLFEFPDGLTSFRAYQNSGYCERFNNCILELAKTYGSYDPHASVCPVRQFTDVDRSAWYHTYLDYVVEQGIFNGMSESSFEPQSTMSRAMMVKTLWAIAGSPQVELPPEKPEVQEPETPDDTDTADTDPTDAEGEGSGEEIQEPSEEQNYQFSDIPADEWYTQAVYWAQQNKVVNGYPDGTFLPNQDVTRQEAAAILYRFAEFRGQDISAAADLSGYSDQAQVFDYARPAMAWTCARGIIEGETESTLNPTGNATRAQVATILCRYMQGGTVTRSRLLEAAPEAVVEPNYYDGGADLTGN